MPVMRSIRWTLVASIVAALLLIPVSISPAGQVELDGLCASAECREKIGEKCYDDGTVYPDAQPIVTEID